MIIENLKINKYWSENKNKKYIFLLILWYGFLDVLTTIWHQSLGVEEGNPLFAYFFTYGLVIGLIGMVIYKCSVGWLLLYLDNKTLYQIIILLSVLVVGHNLYTISKILFNW